MPRSGCSALHWVNPNFKKNCFLQHFLHKYSCIFSLITEYRWISHLCHSMEHSWYICFNTTQSVVFLMLLLGAVEPQLYSCELFCHSGLEPYIWIHSSLLLGYIRFVSLLSSSVLPTILFTVSYACAILFFFLKIDITMCICYKQ